MLRKAKYVWKQIPLLRFLLPLVIGIVTGIAFPSLEFAWIVIGLAAVSTFLFLLLSATGALRSLAMYIAAYGVGYALTIAHTDKLFPNHHSRLPFGYQKQAFLGQIVSDPIEREKSVKMEFELKALKQDSIWQKMDGKILMYVQTDSSSAQLALGDEMMVMARMDAIEAPKNPAQFDYKQYLNLHQIYYQSYVPQNNWSLMQKGSSLMRSIKSWQHDIISIVESNGIDDRELAIVSALLVGYKHHLSSDQVDAFARAGAMHVLAVSGLHVGIVFLIVGYMLRFLNRWRWGEIIRALILLAVLWFYALLTGLSPSVTRACTMFSFVIVATLINRHSDIFNTIVASAVFLLVLNPYLIVEVGFQLSYIAVLGIVILQPRLYELWQPKWWLLDRIWALTAVSVAAQLATFPLALLYFHQFPNYFLLSNLIVVPMASIILPAGMVLVLMSALPVVSEPIGKVLYYLVHFLDGFILWAERLPYAVIEGIDIGVVETILIYGLIISTALFLIVKRYFELAFTLVLLCCLEAWNVVEVYQQREQNLMVFYSLRDGDALDLIDGRNHVFIADTSVVNSKQSLDFNVRPHWWQRDLSPPVTKEYIDPLIFWNDRIILSLNDSMHIDSIGRLDILWVRARTMQHPKEILHLTDPEHVVLSPNLDWSSHGYWMRLLKEKGIFHHSLKEDGAMVYDQGRVFNRSNSKSIVRDTESPMKVTSE